MKSAMDRAQPMAGVIIIIIVLITLIIQLSLFRLLLLAGLIFSNS